MSIQRWLSNNDPWAKSKCVASCPRSVGAATHANSSAITFAQYVMAVTAAPAGFGKNHFTIQLGRFGPEHGSDPRAMKKIALILALVFPLTTGMALTSAFAFRLLPLSTDPCYIAKEGTPHFVAIPPSDGLARLAVLVR